MICTFLYILDMTNSVSFVLLLLNNCLTLLVPSCDGNYDLRIRSTFGSSLLPFVFQGMHVSFVICIFLYKLVFNKISISFDVSVVKQYTMGATTCPFRAHELVMFRLQFQCSIDYCIFVIVMSDYLFSDSDYRVRIYIYSCVAIHSGSLWQRSQGIVSRLTSQIICH